MKKHYYFACTIYIVSLLACAKVEPGPLNTSIPRLKTVTHITYEDDKKLIYKDSFIYDGIKRLVIMQRTLIGLTDSVLKSTIQVIYNGNSTVPSEYMVILPSNNTFAQKSDHIITRNAAHKIIKDSLVEHYIFSLDASYTGSMTTNYTYSGNKIFITRSLGTNLPIIGQDDFSTNDTLTFDAALKNIIQYAMATKHQDSNCTECVNELLTTITYSYSNIPNPFYGLYALPFAGFTGDVSMFSTNLPNKADSKLTTIKLRDNNIVSADILTNVTTWSWTVNSKNHATHVISSPDDAGDREEVFFTYYY